LTIRHVLLVPAPDDPHGLLREGPCGVHPPAALHYPEDDEESPGWQPAGVRDGFYYTAIQRRVAGDDVVYPALVLVWDGEPVPEGCDRAARARGHRAYLLAPKVSDALRLARACEETGLGTAVVVED